MSADKYYYILDLRPGATFEEVKRSYRKHAKLYHPDRNKHPLAPEKFKAIQNAYQTLKEMLLSEKKYEKAHAKYNPEEFRSKDKVYKKEKSSSFYKDYQDNSQKYETEDIKESRFSFFKKIFSKKYSETDDTYKSEDFQQSEEHSYNPQDDNYSRNIASEDLLNKLFHSKNAFIKLMALKILCFRNNPELIDTLLIASNSDKKSVRKYAQKEIKSRLNKDSLKIIEKIWLEGDLSKKFQILTVAEELNDIRFKILFRLHKQKLPAILRKRIFNFLDQ